MKKLLLTLLLLAGSAHGEIIYDWAGTCENESCARASAVIVMQDNYVPGTAFSCAGLLDCDVKSLAWFVEYLDGAVHEAHFESSLLPDITGFGSLPATVGTTLFQMRFSVAPDPAFSVIPEPAGPSWFLTGDLARISPHGFDSLFVRRIAQVAEPGALTLATLGLLGLAVFRRKSAGA
jgi:hypothetical protein